MSERRDDSLYLDCYETEDGTRWCWKKGLLSSQEFRSKAAALEAWRTDRLQFASLDSEV